MSAAPSRWALTGPERAVIDQAKARCECMGECGATHRYEPDLPPLRCGAPHGTKIRRCAQKPDFWVPELPEVMLRDAELFARDIYEVRLSVVTLGKRKAAFCERCARGLRARRQKGRTA